MWYALDHELYRGRMPKNKQTCISYKMYGPDYLTLSCERETDNISESLDTVRDSPELSEEKKRFLNSHPIVSSVYNFLREFSLHNEYRERPGFNNTKESHTDAYPNKLTPADSTLGLVDSGVAINIGCPPVLRAHRRADVILCLENSWDEDRLMVRMIRVEKLKYKSEPTREVYVFEDEMNPDAPIVIGFPLANVSFKKYKAAGVKRGDNELNEGNIDVSSSNSLYKTMNLTFKSEDFRRLVNLTCYNILNNKEIIRNALKKSLNKKGLVNKPIAERTNDCILA